LAERLCRTVDWIDPPRWIISSLFWRDAPAPNPAISERIPRRNRGQRFNINLIDKPEATSAAGPHSQSASLRFDQLVRLKSNKSILDLRAPHADLTPIDTSNGWSVSDEWS
jgi:hypothetical protein